MPRFRPQSQAAVTAATYGIFAFLWILLSDWLLAAIVDDLRTLSLLQTFKGWFFVAVTTALVYGLVHRQVARILRAEKDLQASEERYRAVVEGTDDLVTQVDGEGRFTFVNHRAPSILGLSPSECLGLSAFDFVHAEDREGTKAWFKQCLVTKVASDSIENRQISRDGTVTWMLWTVNFRYGPDGALDGVRAIARDITDRKLAEKTLQENLRIKSEFISMAAHELRTPLASVMGFSEMLLNASELGGFDLDRQREFIAIIHRKSETLSSIVDDLLDLSRIDTGQEIRFDMRQCDLGELAKKVVAHFSARFPARQISLDLGAGCSAHILADPGRMEQVMENLLENALKYSPEGEGVEVSCRVAEGAFRYAVSDRGRGMSRETASKVFDKFYRGDPSDTGISGMGLGLSIVKHIVERHGGRVEIDTAIGRGTTFTAIIPLQELSRAAK